MVMPPYKSQHSCGLTGDIVVFRLLVPSGASTGTHEAVELRDKESSTYGSKSTIRAVNNVLEIIGPALVIKKLNPRIQLKEFPIQALCLDRLEYFLLNSSVVTLPFFLSRMFAIGQISDRSQILATRKSSRLAQCHNF